MEEMIRISEWVMKSFVWSGMTSSQLCQDHLEALEKNKTLLI